MRELVEIKRREEPRAPTGRACPSCRGTLFQSRVPCPDGKLGCLVIHYGMQCGGCGRFWQ